MRYSDSGRKYLSRKRKSSRSWELIHVSAMVHNDKFQLAVPAVLSVSVTQQLATQATLFWYTISWRTKKGTFNLLEIMSKKMTTTGSDFGRKEKFQLTSRPSAWYREVFYILLSVHECMYASRHMFVCIDPCYVCMQDMCVIYTMYA